MNKLYSFRLSDKAQQILDKQDNKTSFVTKAIIRADTVGDDENRCYKCGLVLPIVCFDKDKTNKKGVGYLCKCCKAIKNSKTATIRESKKDS